MYRIYRGPMATHEPWSHGNIWAPGPTGPMGRMGPMQPMGPMGTRTHGAHGWSNGQLYGRSVLVGQWVGRTVGGSNGRTTLFWTNYIFQITSIP